MKETKNSILLSIPESTIECLIHWFVSSDNENAVRDLIELASQSDKFSITLSKLLENYFNSAYLDLVANTQVNRVFLNMINLSRIRFDWLEIADSVYNAMEKKN